MSTSTFTALRRFIDNPARCTDPFSVNTLRTVSFGDCITCTALCLTAVFVTVSTSLGLRVCVTGGSSGLTITDWTGTADAFTEFFFQPYGSGNSTRVQQAPVSRDNKFLFSAGNGALGHIRININSSTASLARIRMIDSRGRIVARTESMLRTGFNSVKVSSVSIANGVYMCRFEYKNGERWVRQDIRLSVVKR